MPTRRLPELDVNLLSYLEALLEDRNLTRAAERLGVTQPAVSAALRRLRRHFDDELLHRVGNRYELTPLAVHLLARVGPALAGVRRVFDATVDFDPATQEREFTIIGSDYAVAVLSEVLAEITTGAPGVRIRFRLHQVYDQLDETLRAVDGMLIPHGFLSRVPHVDLYEDRWVGLVDAHNDRVGEELTVEQLAEMEWVSTYDLPSAITPAQQQLRVGGLHPTVSVVTDAFLTIPFLVAGSDRVGVLQERLARRLATTAGVRMVALPPGISPMREAFWWDASHRTDPAHQWLRQSLQHAARALPPL